MIYTGWACPGRTRELPARAREPGPDPYAHRMHTGLSERPRLDHFKLTLTAMPTPRCVRTAHNERRSSRISYTSGTVDRTYLELVALYYRAGPQGALLVRICARPRPPSNTEDRAQQAQQAPAPRLAIRRFAVGLERRSAHPRPKGHTTSMVRRNRLCSVPRQYVSDVRQEGL